MRQRHALVSTQRDPLSSLYSLCLIDPVAPRRPQLQPFLYSTTAVSVSASSFASSLDAATCTSTLDVHLAVLLTAGTISTFPCDTVLYDGCTDSEAHPINITDCHALQLSSDPTKNLQSKTDSSLPQRIEFLTAAAADGTSWSYQCKTKTEVEDTVRGCPSAGCPSIALDDFTDRTTINDMKVTFGELLGNGVDGQHIDIVSPSPLLFRQRSADDLVGLNSQLIVWPLGMTVALASFGDFSVKQL
ncbi:hypothetical protein C8R43DRAFT_1166823 [Mycena crocata]|nr:hypothetical protein C8R43DRAFT_1166823 [Mycena crocata]